MSEDRKITEERRRFLKLVSGSAVLVPVMGISACSGGTDDAPPAAPKADAPPAAPKADAAAAAPKADAAPAAATSGMPRISEDDPQAKSLAYVHEASSIDATKQPRYKAGQACSNCALYQGKAGSEWGGCSIFPGKAVKASGWCSVYAPKPA
ncbi:MAG: high-potential iron-sulfur protein [Woeseiaceae bacterium]